MIIQIGPFVLFTRSDRQVPGDARDREIDFLRKSGDREIDFLRKSQDELADQLADANLKLERLQAALDEVKVEILDAGETDRSWEDLAREAWPRESEMLFGAAADPVAWTADTDGDAEVVG